METLKTSFDELRELFSTQQMDSLPTKVEFHEKLVYERAEQNKNPFGSYHWELYTTINEDYKHQALLFMWKQEKLALVPNLVIKYSAKENLAEDNRPVISKHVHITLPQLNVSDIECKVDTGAGQCCLHAEDIKSTGESVSFVFEGKRITMNQSDSVSIKTADNGGDDRPVIKLDVQCEQGTYKDIEFNLNDRSDMPHKVLLGLNFLKQGQFLIDPLKESLFDVNEIDEFVKTFKYRG